MIIALYVLFAISVFFPIYTYAIYPFILCLLPNKEYKTDNNYKPNVSVIIILGEDETARLKIENLKKSEYPSNKLEILTAFGREDLNACINRAKGEIIVFSDAETAYDNRAITRLVMHFADEQIGCVVGRVRNQLDNDGMLTESAYWRYENKVKEFESKIGCLSGANDAIYAVRKDKLPTIKKNIINLNFFVSTSVTQSGMAVVLAPDAIAYKEPMENSEKQFQRHVLNGTGYYQALSIFWRMLFPRKGSFVYVSHRVCKWLVPLNLIAVFAVSIVLAFYSVPMLVLTFLQVSGYFALLVFYILYVKQGNKKRMRMSKIINLFFLLFYFTSLNLAYVIGLVKFVLRERKSQ